MKARVIATIDAAGFETNKIEIRTNGGAGANKFAFNWTAPEEFGRREQGGPILSGPYLYGYGLCSVIHNGPVTAAPTVIHLQDGDLIEVRNLVERGHLRTYTFHTEIKRGYPKFTCIEGWEYAGANRGKTNVRTEPVEISRVEYSEYLRNECK